MGSEPLYVKSCHNLVTLFSEPPPRFAAAHASAESCRLCRPASGEDLTANLCTKIMDFRGFEGWNSHAHREFPGSYESTSLIRDNLSREMGSTSGVFIHCLCLKPFESRFLYIGLIRFISVGLRLRDLDSEGLGLKGLSIRNDRKPRGIR